VEKRLLFPAQAAGERRWLNKTVQQWEWDFSKKVNKEYSAKYMLGVELLAH